MRTFILVFLLTVSFTINVYAQGLPSYVSMPNNLKYNDTLTEETFGEAEFRLPNKDSHIQQGHHWHTDMHMDGVPEEITGKAIWSRIKASLLKGGWTVAGEYDENPFSSTAHFKKGREAWITFQLFSSEDIRMDLVEVSEAEIQLKLPPPAASAEKISPDSGNFPYLLPLPGSTLVSSGFDPKPMEINMPGSEETQIVGSGVITKDYTTPATISNLEFVTAYFAALKSAGWNIIHKSQGINQSDTVLLAHYDRGGRDIWAYLHYAPGDLSIQVADAGKQDIAQALKKDCHVALTGVLFEFNKASLRPESAPVLTRAREALKARPDLDIEVQGHTDNVGTDAYNQKLSEARAQSIMKWLSEHGIPARRLTSKGYGKGKPVDNNDTATGRARNRRVELACRK